jgi:hypothetical protein
MCKFNIEFTEQDEFNNIVSGKPWLHKILVQKCNNEATKYNILLIK